MSKYYSLIRLTWRQRNLGNINGSSLLNVPHGGELHCPCRFSRVTGRGATGVQIVSQTSRSGKQALPATGPLPNGHTNRSTESCGTSVNSNSPVGLWMGHCYSKPSHQRLNPMVVPRDREERAFVCLEQEQRKAIKSGLGERFIRRVRCRALQAAWSFVPCQ